ncbi:uncharacterized protein [Tenebrio molitor]|uniref:uncharacterized protein n=1 Tax=Tenebrio molitor TaxID=7067 RepID=UPI003624979A
MVLACTILNMVLERYKSQSCLLRDQIKFGKKATKDVVKLLKQVKLNAFMLKEAVDAFNEIFGWVILLNIFFGCSKVAVLWGNIQKTKFSTKYNYIQILLNLMVDLNLYVHTCYSLVLLLTTKRRQWFKLVNNLSRIDRFATDNTSNLAFVIALVIFLVATILNASWLYNFGWNFLRIYIVEYFQVYSEFFYMVLACTVLTMMLERYKSQSSLLREQIKCGRKKTSKEVVKVLKQIKFNVFMLKQAVDAFNQIFGCIILLNVWYGCTRGLVFLSSLVNGEEQWSEHSIAICWTILLCDTVLKEFDLLVDLSRQLEISLFNLVLHKGNEFYKFSAALLHNQPEFHAARFFSIDRSIIFSILNSMTTFLLVIIQFKYNT